MERGVGKVKRKIKSSKEGSSQFTQLFPEIGQPEEQTAHGTVVQVEE